MRILIISCMVFLLAACDRDRDPIKNMKDLEQSMMDLKIYQENLGDEIEAGRLNEARWLLDGIDSTLETVAATITEHHKMTRPFSYYKKRLLDKPMNGLYDAFDNNDTALARKQYVLLVNKCNKCHIDHEIDKEVRF